MVNQRVFGVIGEVKAELRQLADVQDRLGYAFIELEALVDQLAAPKALAYQSPSRYQMVDRDFTFVAPESLSFQAIADVARKACGNLLRDCQLAQPVYRGDGIAEGHKAISIRLLLQADDRTLSDKELTKLHKKVVASAERQLGIALR